MLPQLAPAVDAVRLSLHVLAATFGSAARSRWPTGSYS